MNIPPNILLSSEQIQSYHKHLQFSYRQFIASNKSLLNLRINNYYITQRIEQQSDQKHIYKAINSSTNQQVVIKMLNLRKIQFQRDQSIKSTLKRLVHSQSRLMMLFDSVHVLKCYQCYQNVDFKFIILEYCNQGTLQDKINNQNNIEEKQAITILKQIINGIIQCHKKNVIHRDIKAQNIFINNGICKIADFGFSKQLDHNNENELSINTCLGTLTTMAPQVYQQQPYGLKADIWSIGIILFQMIFGIIPYTANTKQRLIQQMNNLKNLISTIQQYNGIKPSRKLRNFLCSVLDANVETRLGWKELLGHEIFKSQNYMEESMGIKNGKDRREIKNKFASSFLVDVDINQVGEQLFQKEKEYIVNSKNFDISQFQIKQSDKKQKTITSKPKQQQKVQKNIKKPIKLKQQQKIQLKQQQKIQLKQQQTIQVKQQQSNSSSSTPTNLFLKPQFTLQNSFPQQKQQENSSFLLQVISIIKKQQNLKNNQEIRQNKQSNNKSQRQKEEYFIPDHLKQRYQQQFQFKREKDQQYEQKPGNFPHLNDKKKQSNLSNQPYQQQLQVQPYNNNMMASSQYFIKNSMISYIEQSQLLLRRQQVKNQQQQLSKFAHRMHLQCLKTQTIYQNIVQVIQLYSMFDLNKRQIIQMMYLICTRCLNNISPINFQYEKRKDNIIMKTLLSNVKQLNKKVSDKWLYYSNQLTKKQNQVVNYCLDIGKKFMFVFSQQRKIKDKFLTGIQSYKQFKPKSLQAQLKQLQQIIDEKQKNKKIKNNSHLMIILNKNKFNLLEISQNKILNKQNGTKMLKIFLIILNILKIFPESNQKILEIKSMMNIWNLCQCD